MAILPKKCIKQDPSNNSLRSQSWDQRKHVKVLISGISGVAIESDYGTSEVPDP